VDAIVTSCLSPDEVRVVQGAADVSKALVAEPFDHIYFTGSTQVGKAVARAASENLSTLTLELGGKSPTIVDETADIGRAAERIAFGKFSNAGQTCLAPDYLFVHESRYDAFVEALNERLDRFYGATESSPDYGRVVSERHAERLAELCADALERGATLLRGGQSDPSGRYLEPTLLTDLPGDAAVMQEEIFGPILPIFRYTDLAEVLEEISARPTPLALYIFSESEDAIQRVVSSTNSGSVGVNDTIIQFANPHLPFGGTGNSGQGRGHGHAGFLEFSSQRTVLRQRRRLALVSLFYPPYDELKRRAIKALLKRYRIG
ncbi:MAG: aldehyde dehydrogenase family protein, partial [Rhodothermales bacterium]|nr:aldehyde dehydrogenase family protein [Rhodothermales bacterium]